MTTSVGLWWHGMHPELAAALTTLGPTLCGLGLVEITLGIIAEVLIRMHFELQQKDPYRIARTSNFPPSSNTEE